MADFDACHELHSWGFLGEFEDRNELDMRKVVETGRQKLEWHKRRDALLLYIMIKNIQIKSRYFEPTLTVAQNQTKLVSLYKPVATYVKTMKPLIPRLYRYSIVEALLWHWLHCILLLVTVFNHCIIISLYNVVVYDNHISSVVPTREPFPAHATIDSIPFIPSIMGDYKQELLSLMKREDLGNKRMWKNAYTVQHRCPSIPAYIAFFFIVDCVDCASPNPQWASVPLGIFICLSVRCQA